MRSVATLTRTGAEALARVHGAHADASLDLPAASCLAGLPGDALELRLDSWCAADERDPGAHSWPAAEREQRVVGLVAAVRAAIGPRRLVVACPGRETRGAAGAFEGSRDQRLAVLAAAVAAGADWVDLDLDVLAGKDGELRPLALEQLAGARLLLSLHPDQSCDPLQLDACLERLLTCAEAIGIAPSRAAAVQASGDRSDPEGAGSTSPRVVAIKLVPRVADLEEGLELLAWTRERSLAADASWRARGLLAAVFGAGPGGAATRSAALALGSDFVYASAVEARLAAVVVEGQPDFPALMADWTGALVDPAGPASAHVRRAPSDATELYGVLGHPLAGSLSPQLFSALFQSAGHDGLFLRLDLADSEAAFRLARPVPDGGLAQLGGLSVTAPHKAAARRFASNSLDPALRSIGAVNTLFRPRPGAAGEAAERRSLGANTDVAGVRAALDELFADVSGGWSAALADPARPLVVLGAGGAARAVLAGVSAVVARDVARHLGGLAEGPPDGARDDSGDSAGAGSAARIVVLARSPKRAMALAREFGAGFGAIGELGELDPACVVHTTTAGSPADPALRDDPEHASWVPGPELLAALAARAPDCRILDANLRPRPTALVASAQRLGLRACDGTTWFLAQALAQYRLFTGSAYPRPSDARALLEGLLEDCAPSPPDPSAAAGQEARPWLVLVGLRAAGKTSVGRLLAERLGLRFHDLDADLVAAAGDPATSAGELLAALGEPAFRELEVRCLAERLDSAPAAASAAVAGGLAGVLASGGGVVETVAGRARLAGPRALCVWLCAPPAELAHRRSGEAPEERPALVPGAGPLEESLLLAERRGGWYAELAALVLDTDGREPADLADELAAWCAAVAGAATTRA